MKPKVIAAIAIVVAIIAAFIIIKGGGDGEGKDGWYTGTVKVGHLVALDMAPLFVAKESGFFKEEGLDLKTVFFANPGDNNAALAGGSIQFSTNPFTLPYLADSSGVPMRIISSAGGLGIIEVVIQKQYNVEDVPSLAEWVKTNPGKKLKVGSLKGDTLDMILYKAFNDVGLTYDDFEMIWFNDLLAMVQSFETDQIDILSHIKPYTTRMIVEKGAKSITNNSEVWGEGTPNCTVAVMDDFLEKYPKSVEAYLKAIQRGFQLMVNDPEKAVSLLDGGNYYKVDTNVLLYALKNQPNKVLLQPNVEGMMQAINDMVKQGYIKTPGKNVVQTKILDGIEPK